MELHIMYQLVKNKKRDFKNLSFYFMKLDQD